MRTAIVGTKFGVNDTAFVLWGNKICEVRVTAINVRLETSGKNTSEGYPHVPNVIINSYQVMFPYSDSRDYRNKIEFSPDSLFETKQDLLDSL